MIARASARSIALAIATLVAASCGGETRQPVIVGAPAPTYAARTLEGAPITLAELRGEVVLLNIWATWCKPCRQEIPALETLHQRHAAAGLRIVGVSIDSPGEEANVASYARELGATYPLWHDPDNRVSSTFLAIGVPASYLIGRDGILRWRHVGPVTADDAPLTTALTTALAEGR